MSKRKTVEFTFGLSCSLIFLCLCTGCETEIRQEFHGTAINLNYDGRQQALNTAIDGGLVRRFPDDSEHHCFVMSSNRFAVWFHLPPVRNHQTLKSNTHSGQVAAWLVRGEAFDYEKLGRALREDKSEPSGSEKLSGDISLSKMNDAKFKIHVDLLAEDQKTALQGDFICYTKWEFHPLLALMMPFAPRFETADRVNNTDEPKTNHEN